MFNETESENAKKNKKMIKSYSTPSHLSNKLADRSGVLNREMEHCHGDLSGLAKLNSAILDTR